MTLYYISLLLYRRVLDRFFGIRDSEFKSKIGTRFGIEIMFGRGMPKITLGITGLHKILGRDYGIEEPYWGPSYRYSIRLNRCDVLKKTCCFAANLSPFYNRGYPVWSPFIWRKLVPGGRVYPIHSRTGEPTFPTIPYKTWRAVYMRTKKLFQLEGWPA